MSTPPGSRAPLLAIIALIALVAIGTGLFVYYNLPPAAQVNSGTPVPGNAGGPNAIQGGPLTAVAGDTVVTLTWQPVQGATGYLVRRDNGHDPLNTKPITATQYLDIGLTDGRTYTYTVAPVTSSTEGAQLPPVQVVPSFK